MTYSPDEVREAFEMAALPLAEADLPITSLEEFAIFVPRSRDAVTVYVSTDQEADVAWPDYVRLGGDEDSLTVRRANVIAVSDGDLSRVAMQHVRSAMSALPDRGYAVDVVEDR
jgi:hypothetical protein